MAALVTPKSFWQKTKPQSSQQTKLSFNSSDDTTTRNKRKLHLQDSQVLPRKRTRLVEPIQTIDTPKTPISATNVSALASHTRRQVIIASSPLSGLGLSSSTPDKLDSLLGGDEGFLSTGKLVNNLYSSDQSMTNIKDRMKRSRRLSRPLHLTYASPSTAAGKTIGPLDEFDYSNPDTQLLNLEPLVAENPVETQFLVNLGILSQPSVETEQEDPPVTKGPADEEVILPHPTQPDPLHATMAASRTGHAIESSYPQHPDHAVRDFGLLATASPKNLYEDSGYFEAPSDHISPQNSSTCDEIYAQVATPPGSPIHNTVERPKYSSSIGVPSMEESQLPYSPIKKAGNGNLPIDLFGSDETQARAMSQLAKLRTPTKKRDKIRDKHKHKCIPNALKHWQTVSEPEPELKPITRVIGQPVQDKLDRFIYKDDKKAIKEETELSKAIFQSKAKHEPLKGSKKMKPKGELDDIEVSDDEDRLWKKRKDEKSKINIKKHDKDLKQTRLSWPVAPTHEPVFRSMALRAGTLPSSMLKSLDNSQLPEWQRKVYTLHKADMERVKKWQECDTSSGEE